MPIMNLTFIDTDAFSSFFDYKAPGFAARMAGKVDADITLKCKIDAAS
jgi:hypothetical protein